MSHNLIWDYFTKSKTDASKAKCTSKLLSLGSDMSGQIYSDHRNNLLGENAEKLLFLTYIKLFNFNY